LPLVIRRFRPGLDEELVAGAFTRPAPDWAGTKDRNGSGL
jgi:hypothetical protein